MKTNGSQPTSRVVRLPKCPTGIRGLDEITGGGLPRGRPTLVCGGAGCGKTLFATAQPPAHRRPNGRLGLLSMRERAAFVGGTLAVKSTRRAGTEVEVRIPMAPRVAATRLPKRRTA